VGLLYYRFPSESIAAYLESAVVKANPRILLSLKNVRPAFPLSVDFIGAKMYLKKAPQKPFMSVKNLSLRPEAWAFLQGTQVYHFNVNAYGGNLKGNVRFEDLERMDSLTATMKLKDLHIGRHPYLSALMGRDVSGVLGGDIVYSGQYNNLIEGVGEAILNISGGRVHLLQPILGFESLQFDRLSMKMTLKNKKVVLSDVGLQGPAVKGQLSGTIILNNDIQASRLDLRGTLEPLGGLFGNLKGKSNSLKFLRQSLKNLQRSFVIRGTFRDPEFRFLEG
jgi:type II secretion system protein N